MVLSELNKGLVLPDVAFDINAGVVVMVSLPIDVSVGFPVDFVVRFTSSPDEE